MRKNEPGDPTGGFGEGLVGLQKFHKEGMRLTLQKFQNRVTARQLLLTEGGFQEGPELEKEIEVSELNFSVPQYRAVTALNYLLDQTDFEGNRPPTPEQEYERFRWKGLLPRLRITYADFFAAYGLKRDRGGAFHGNQANEALGALRSLAEPWRVCYTRQNGKKTRQGSPRYDAIVTRAPLVNIIKFYRDVPEKAATVLRNGGDLDSRVTALLIEFSPLWLDGIASFYLLKPVTLYKQIRALHPGRRSNVAVYAFCDFLLTINRTPFTISERALEEKLWLNRYRGQRQPKRIRKLLDRAYWTAKELGLLERYQLDDFGLSVILFLNPALCRRIKGLLSPNGGDDPNLVSDGRSGSGVPRGAPSS
jgi:hypothetical protein